MKTEPLSLRHIRRVHGFSYQQLSTLADVSETDLRKWERGLEFPDVDALKRLADVFKMDELELRSEQLERSKLVVRGEGYTTAKVTHKVTVERSASPPAGRLRVLDLFCGAGGLSHGFEQSGEFVTTCGLDLLPDRIESFSANHRYANGISGDLTTYELEELAEIAEPVDVVVGGPPCQGFSSIRPFRFLTEGDPRNSLVEQYVLIINHLRPSWFVFENVVGILTHQNGQRLTAVLEGLIAAGYDVEWKVLNAAIYGVPQFRERVVIVGNRNGVKYKWPEPTHHAEHRSMAGARKEVIQTGRGLFSDHLPNAITLTEAINDLPALHAGQESHEYASSPQNEFQRRMRGTVEKLSLHRATSHSQKMLEIIRLAGSNIHALPPGLVKSGFSSCYSRLDANRPSTTLTVNFVHPASNRCIHPNQDRALTPREGARIQSFPDDYVFLGNAAQVVKQIGNAVPPELGRRLAEGILASR